MTSEPWCLASLLTTLSMPAPSLSHPWKSPNSNMTRGSISLILMPSLCCLHTAIYQYNSPQQWITSDTYHLDGVFLRKKKSCLFHLHEGKGMIFLFSNFSKIHSQFFFSATEHLFELRQVCQTPIPKYSSLRLLLKLMLLVSLEALKVRGLL